MVDGISPALSAAILVVPYLFAAEIGIQSAFYASLLLGLAVLSALVVYLFLKKTRLGTAVRAASEDMEATTLQGINSTWVCAVSFAVGIGLAGVAGVGMATVYSFDYQFGFAFAIKALIALSLGGIGNVFGALAGGLILGVIENLTDELYVASRDPYGVRPNKPQTFMLGAKFGF